MPVVPLAAAASRRPILIRIARRGNTHVIEPAVSPVVAPLLVCPVVKPVERVAQRKSGRVTRKTAKLQ